MQEYVLRTFGSPEQFGAFEPAGDFATVGRALSQHYLPLVAEGRIAVKPWIDKIVGQIVQFADGSAEEFDAIVFGTGFDLVCLPQPRDQAPPGSRRQAHRSPQEYLPSRLARTCLCWSL